MNLAESRQVVTLQGFGALRKRGRPAESQESLKCRLEPGAAIYEQIETLTHERLKIQPEARGDTSQSKGTAESAGLVYTLSCSLGCLPVDMSSTLYATPRRSFFHA